MDIDEVYLTLNLISEKAQLDSDDIELLLKLSKSDDSEIRAYVAELLVLGIGHESEKVLIDMCMDDDELVRVNACDSLSAFATVDVYHNLVNCALNDKSILVRNYALLSLTDIINSVDVDKNKIKNLFLDVSKNKEVAVLAACFKGLYILGEKEYLEKLLDLVATPNYQDKCAVINTLGDILTIENNDCIISELKKIMKSETSEAVRSTIDRIIREKQNSLG